MPAAPRETSVLEHQVRVAAHPETVFGYFTDPAKMVQWMGVEATLDPRPGGICRIAFQPSRAHVEHLSEAFFGLERGSDAPELQAPSAMMGKFVEVDPHQRIVITWGWELEVLALPPQSTLVEVSFTPEGGDTILRLAHRRLPPEAVAFHREGWDHYLARLAIAASGDDPGPDSWHTG